jgi:hypothetical protein
MRDRNASLWQQLTRSLELTKRRKALGASTMHVSLSSRWTFRQHDTLLKRFSVCGEPSL